ncbi:SUF system NifU family Fe-S cluster assembly protein [Deinococcus sp. KNUC1210]|uniref:Fe-S cluster assembly sulfur transfer protein SufU n=1 Tax=Deinococcus sp. KNUC1210 TaxID=2917691 RepID=UPI001EF08670|nr:SUF system NifU family Fe-S cluster assembly protein [Deinococcus sp. KNUC1210]ULH15000.1 SUF system NifU family Fe-S cluster assembly protein [Deinococcus sp. KNUC1210]
MLSETLARELIAAHSRRPHHFGALEGAPSLPLDNPGCGDRVTVWVKLDGETLHLSFEGQGCAISQASASMMADALDGKTRSEAQALSAAFHAMISGETPPGSELGELQALAGVSRLHARRKCALLAWRALGALL